MSVASLLAFAALVAWPFRGEVPPETVVARAATEQGVIEITADRLATYCEANPGRSPREAADELVAFELLVREARARGLDTSVEARKAGAEAAVPIYLKRVFEAEVSLESIPVDLLQRAYDKNLRFFKRPELRNVDHILVGSPGFVPIKDPELEAAAKGLIDVIRADLSTTPPTNVAEFLSRIDHHKGAAAAAGLELKAEPVPRVPKRGPYEQKFADTTFELAAPGAISRPVKTPFGFHIIRLESIEPAIDRSLDDAQAELRKRSLPDYRSMELKRRTDALLEEAGIAVNLGLLGVPAPSAGQP